MQMNLAPMESHFIAILDNNLNRENTQPNYKGPPQCFKGFCPQMPLSHFASWFSLEFPYKHPNLELNKQSILMMTVFFRVYHD